MTGCLSSSKPQPGVDVLRSDKRGYMHIPGPMPGFGYYPTQHAALVAGCPVIMKLPGAVIPVPRWHQDFQQFWRRSTEFCGIIYETPKGFTLSMLTEDPSQPFGRARTCLFPDMVDDTSSPAVLIRAFVHGHPGGSNLSQGDVDAILAELDVHRRPVTIVAYVAVGGQGSSVVCTGWYELTVAKPHGETFIRYFDFATQEYEDAAKVNLDTHQITPIR